MNLEEELEYEVNIWGVHLEHVHKFIYLECGLDKAGIDGAECSR